MIQRSGRVTRGLLLSLVGAGAALTSHASSISQVPLFLTQAVEPIVMLSLSNDHQLYFEAYNEYTDLTGDGVPNTTYTHSVDYYGYFDSYKCYSYSGGRFVPQAETGDKYCDGVSGSWSGNFLNWLTMARIDIVRKVLYGGYRSTDSASSTVLERTYLPNDAHSWARHYSGNDLHRLSAISGGAWHQHAPSANTTASTSINVTQLRQTIADHSEWHEDKQRTFSLPADFPAHPGDQVWIVDSDNENRVLQGYLQSHSGNEWTVLLQWAQGSGTGQNWTVRNESRVGVTFCNTTVAGNALSQDVDEPPLLRVAAGNYALWGANERWQCRWADERSNTLAGSGFMHGSMEPNSNGNIAAISGLQGATENPDRGAVGLGEQDYTVRVEVCVDGLLEENCQEYDTATKPVGLLQQFGEDERIRFGMTSGSYARNLSGGVLRKPAGPMTDEINPVDGTFIESGPSIIGTLNRLRIYGYRHDIGHYHSADNSDDCIWGRTSFSEGQCSNWGNPQSELFLETLRYLAGRQSPVYDADDSGRISGLLTADWDDPVESNKWCAPMSIIQFNASTSSYDGQAGQHFSDIQGGTLSTWTNDVGVGEGIPGNSFFVGESGSANNQICTAKTVGNLSEVAGICPDEPRLGGTYDIAGLAYYARTNSIRNDLQGEQTVQTFGVELAPAVPQIPIPNADGSRAATLLPACRERRDGRTPEYGNCAIVDFKVVFQETTGSGSRGQFFVQWEDSEQGGDYDMDMSGVLSYELAGTTLTVRTRTFSDSSDGEMGFGYVVSGTTNDGFHVHSGINGYSELGCSGGCWLLDAETERTYTIGGSEAQHLERPLFYAAKWGGFDTRMADDPTQDPASWDSSGNGIPNNYFFATDPRELEESLRSAFTSVAETVSSVAAIATNSTRLSADTLIYQARFNSEDWSGELLAFEIDEGDGQVNSTPLWNVTDFIQSPNDRRIFTVNSDTGQGMLFRWIADLGADQQTAVGSQAKLDWLRGDRSDPALREMDSPLSDIVNSDPAFSGAQNFGFAQLDGADGAAYTGYLQDKAGRAPTIFVGSNGGMLHAFHAENGGELFAFVPQGAYAHIGELPMPDYQHRYFVDGSPRLMDVYFNDEGRWGTVLIGSMGAGGRSIFALDVSNPETFSASDILWEITGDESSDLQDHLGTSIPQPTIARMADGNFWAIFANGYESAEGHAGLFLLNMSNPSQVLFFDTRAGPTPQLGPNGLSTPIPVDTTGNRIADRIYAGDLHGNLWRFDVDSSNTNQWGFDNAFSQGQNRFPLFQARDVANTENVQPITARPEVGRHPDRGVLVYFGTGAFFRVGDNDVDGDDTHHSFYGIRDQGAPVSSDQSGLLIQEIEFEGAAFGTDVRVVSQAEEDEDKQDGWRLDLVSPVNGFEGERVIDAAQLRFGRIIFTTLIPSSMPCDFGGSSWLMELDAITGGNFGRTIFDLNDDGLFDEDDFVDMGDETAPVSGLRTQVGISARPAIISAGEEEYKYMSGSSGEIERVREISGTDELGRQSWRQIR